MTPRPAFLGLVAATSLGAGALLLRGFAKDGLAPLEGALVPVWTLLFLWIGVSFWTAVFGFAVRMRGSAAGSPPGVGTGAEAHPPLPAEVRVAVAMPVCNEDPARVCAGVLAMAESLVRSGGHRHFEFFILSDTTDPVAGRAEERHWLELRGTLRGRVPVHYRRRPVNVGRKAGNLADFCRRWGGRYRYMVVLDADSVISGDTLLRLVRTMEREPRTGILQVLPVAVGRDSLFARITQFASSLYGPLFAAGLSAWQRGEAQYWGHNAIVRVKPFTEHCGLPRLPGREPFGGEILSHDFVEAALMRRAGWEVRLVDWEGSWEEPPGTLVDHARRDRRWLQGNLQHAWVVVARGIHPMSRLNLLMGIASYLSSVLWLLGIAAAGLNALLARGSGPPLRFHGELVAAGVLTLVLLLAPRVLALVCALREPRGLGGHGGTARAVVSVLLETVVSALLAPILMVFHARFLVSVVLRGDSGWTAQRRADRNTTRAEAVRVHLGHTLLGLGAGALALHAGAELFVWSLPVLAGLAASIPLSVLTSRAGAGRWARRAGLFLTPAESGTPQVLARLGELLGEASGGGVRGGRLALVPLATDRNL